MMREEQNIDALHVGKLRGLGDTIRVAAAESGVASVDQHRLAGGGSDQCGLSSFRIDEENLEILRSLRGGGDQKKEDQSTHETILTCVWNLECYSIVLHTSNGILCTMRQQSGRRGSVLRQVRRPPKSQLWSAFGWTAAHARSVRGNQRAERFAALLYSVGRMDRRDRGS